MDGDSPELTVKLIRIMNTTKLAPEDFKLLKHHCRGGYAMAIGIIFLGSLGFLYFIKFNTMDAAHQKTGYLAFACVFLIAFIFEYMMNHKYRADIKNGIKTIEIKTILQKKHQIAFETQRGFRFARQKMKEVDKYELIFDGSSIFVSKELFDKATEGGKTIIHTAPLSEEILNIELT